MLEGITVALQSYYDTVNGAKNILESAVTQIQANYIGAMFAEKMKEAKEIYHNTLAESRKTNFDACVTIIDDVASQARKVVEVPVPADFIPTVEALKQMKEPTQREVETVVGAYKNNYFAYRAICDFLGTAKPVTIDDIDSELAYIKENLYKCFYSDNLDAYHFRNWKDGNIIKSFDNVFRAFIEGRFEDAVHVETDKE